MLTICQYLTFLSLESTTSEAVTVSVESMEHSLGLGQERQLYLRVRVGVLRRGEALTICQYLRLL